MHSHVLVAVAPDGDEAVDRGLEVARTLVGGTGRITALMVLEDVPGYVAIEMADEVIAQSQSRTTEAFRERFAGVPGVEPVVVHGHPGQEIVDWADKHAVDCIVVMSHRPGPADLILGSTASRVVRHAPTSVHVLR